MKIFSDQHHLSLYNSLRLLFEERLSGKLYRPIGKEWLDEGYWRMAEIYNNAPETVEQYLGVRDDYIPKDGSLPLNRVQKIEEGIFYVWDPEYNYYHKAIPLSRFLNLDINIVIASIPQHIESFKKLCAIHPNKPKFIYQVGNSWNIDQGYADNILASAIIPNVPVNTNMVTYHQEFDLDIFHYGEPNQSKKVYSFINCLGTAEHYKEDWELFLELEKLMPDWEFRSFGGSCRDGAAHGAKALAEKMREAQFVFHVKRWGDGYGHIIHNAAAVGRPIITRLSDYQGKLGGSLITSSNSIIIDGLSPQQIRDKIIGSNSDEMSKSTYENFKSVVDFDKEAEEIKRFLEKLQ
jgi:hypothetical protein